MLKRDSSKEAHKNPSNCYRKVGKKGAAISNQGTKSLAKLANGRKPYLPVHKVKIDGVVVPPLEIYDERWENGRFRGYVIYQEDRREVSRKSVDHGWKAD